MTAAGADSSRNSRARNDILALSEKLERLTLDLACPAGFPSSSAGGVDLSERSESNGRFFPHHALLR